ncbi:hypothetical protein R3X27_16530 [Tropicimonas sp. TH_r6]|uniref:hypothetical protein n=1 Tax=Tropicimonas sp. TH_r6 TaxID=3082085 RepID=UPI002955DBD0|nr:hypothetical protein [Tropicimonas sp. TH_r6]MDV7144292.1 hypothetical protein [Tropicimonas sp. TH_r6]
MIRTYATLATRTAAWLVMALIACLAAPAAQADWVNLGGAEVAPNIAEFHVEDGGVRVVLEVFVEDLGVFSDLVPSEWWKDAASTTPAADTLRLARFAREGLSIRTGDGASLPVEAMAIERRLRVERASPMAGATDPYTGRTMPSPPEDPRVLYAELFYPFGGERPDGLMISPPLDESGQATATLGMIVFHRAVPVIDFRFLSAPAQLALDWNDPWYSRFDTPNLTRHNKYPRMTFLYAEPYEIRHEALVRVRDAMSLVDREIAGGTLSAQEGDALSKAVAAEIGSRTPMTIEGAPVQPDFDRAAFMRIGLRGLEFLQPGEEIDIDADILGLIWSAPTDGLPQQAELEWTWFDSRSPDVAGYAVDAAGPFLFPLTPEDGVVTWTNHFKTPPYPEIAAVELVRPDETPLLLYLLGGIAALSAGFALVSALRGTPSGLRTAVIGAAIAALAVAALPVLQHRQATRLPELEPEQLEALTGDLLNNVYRAFDFRTEDQVYDRLALSLDGPVLEQVYLEQRDALRIERAGGADARVKALDVTGVSPQDTADPGTLRLRAEWVVRGTVGHWGHVHSRTNAYEAELTVVPVDGVWKIRGFDVISQERMM